MVKYHNTVLHFIGIKKEANTGEYDHDYCAIYDGIYPVKAMVVDESIEPVAIDKESLVLNGFTVGVDEDDNKLSAFHRDGIYVKEGERGYFHVEIDRYTGLRGEDHYTRSWSELQALCRAMGLGVTAVNFRGKDDL